MKGPWNAGEGIVGQSACMVGLSARLDRVAKSRLPVLIRGETGVGKELIARAIHSRSPRIDTGVFVSENFAAVSPGLAESELFGHVAGAFTGAVEQHDGLFLRAHEGTLFIDELGDMPQAMQAKLLRVLQDGEARRVGSNTPVRVDVRVVAATHTDLQQLADAGTFRTDLMYRLAVLELVVPPLRSRLEDIPALVAHFLNRLEPELGRELPPASDVFLDALLRYDWPGNVRELENAVRSAALLGERRVLETRALPFVRNPAPRVRKGSEGVDTSSYVQLLEELASRERVFVEMVMHQCKGNKVKAAVRLGVSRYALYRTLKRLEIDESTGAPKVKKRDPPKEDRKRAS
ncbi:sigma-54 dependent transcriptional regulator [Planctomycetota bacterium]|nr:sigma-54 dependent transcriptional regulator [Planctomycetota bacterium]